MDDNDKGDALHEENEGMITGLLQEDLLNLFATPTWGEHLKNEDVTCMDLVKTWTDQVVPITKIVPKVVLVAEALFVMEVLSVAEVVSIIEAVFVAEAQSVIKVVFVPRAVSITEVMLLPKAMLIIVVMSIAKVVCLSLGLYPLP